MKYCCDPFYHALENAGNKGFSVIASKENEDIFYYFQSRICDYDFIDEFLSKLKSLPKPLGISLPMQMQKKIDYCPFCGKKLSTLYQVSNPEVAELLEQHSRYLLS